MTRSKRQSRLPFVVLVLLLTVYLWLWTKIDASAAASSLMAVTDATLPNDGAHQTSPFVLPEYKRGLTIIVAFCNYHFRSVGLTWYRRMSALGYDNHLLVATDQPMVDFLASSQFQENLRYDKWIHEPMPKEFKTRPKSKQDQAYLQLLMAVRWKYLVSHLENGVHVVLTDADNIFTRYLDVEEEFSKKDQFVDVYLAYATKFPRKAFGVQGFCVCSGMSWWRASPGAIRFARVMRDTCGNMCDDQRELNNLLSISPKLNMTWQWTTEARQSLVTNETTNDPRFLGLPTRGISGYSTVTGHRVQIWDRDFAFRGPLLPDACPVGNWVAMPIAEALNRQTAWKAKVESFQQWDSHCATDGKVTSARHAKIKGNHNNWSQQRIGS